MIFRTGFIVNRHGTPTRVISDPKILEYEISGGASAHPGQIRVPKLANQIPNGGLIRGSYETSNPAEVKVLLKVGSLFFNPQDAVDEGIFTAEEMIAMGWTVKPPAGQEVKPEAIKVPAVDLPDPLPDFDTISKSALVDWADAQDPPIHLDRRKRKDDLAEEVRAILKERE